MKTLAYSLVAFYSFAAFCLPAGDLSYLPQLPQMFKHCQSHEDKDLHVIDFITDHLINMDSLFDKHTGGDEQKPHRPSLSRHFSNLVLISPTDLDYHIYINPTQVVFAPDVILNPLSKGHSNQVFRPPILAI
jgi:hypothetical protein